MKDTIWSNPMTEIFKWSFFSILVIVGVSLNYINADQLPVYARLVATLCMLGAAGAIAYKTSLGQKFVAFIKSAITELRKVVWPTRHETIQVSVIVIIMVVIMSLILWGFDMILFKLIAWFTGQGA